MKLVVMLTGVIFLFCCSDGSNDSGDLKQSKSEMNSDSSQQANYTKTIKSKVPLINSNEFKTLKVDTHGIVDLSVYASQANICNIFNKNELVELFNVTSDINIEIKKSTSATCHYSWQYESLEARKKATETGENHQFGPKVFFNANAISKEASLLISVSKFKMKSTDFVPEILTELEIETNVQADLTRLLNQMTESNKPTQNESKAVKSRLASMAEKRKNDWIVRNQQYTEINEVGDAAYWDHEVGGGLHVLVGDLHVFISPLIAINKATDVNNAIKVLMQIVE